MKRYLGGEELPPQLMEGLEQHVHACASCSHYLDAQRLKLAAKLSGGKPEKVKEPQPPKGPKDKEVFTKPKQAWLTPKTMGLAAALALVLFAMSAVAKDPTLLFGPKASSTRPAGSLTGGHEADPDAEAEGDSHGEKVSEGDQHSESSSKVGEIMTGETVQKEIEDSLKEEDHSEGEKAHEPEADPQVEKMPDDHASAPEQTDSSTGKAAASHSEPAKPAKEPAKEPDMALVVAEEGKSPKKVAPAPHPKAAPEAAKPRKTSHRAPSRRATSKRRTSQPKPLAGQPAAGGGSIRVYDSAGNPIN